jgi:hypothetical protein
MLRRRIKENSSLLLAIGAGIGVVSTAYLSAVAGYRTAHALEDADPYEPLKEKARRVWTLYIPPATSGAVTIVCLAGVKRIDARKTFAAQTALALSQRAYEGYRAQVIDELGEKRDQGFLAGAAEKRISEKPPTSIITGSGTVLTCELWTGRYFNSDMQTLKSAVNEINAKMLRNDYATLDDFYYEIGLENTMISGQAGWEAAKLLELQFSSILHEGKPVLAFDYNYVKSF